MDPQHPQSHDQGSSGIVGRARARQVAAAVAGVLAALLVWEMVLRPLDGLSRVPPRPRVACDTLGSPVIVTRQTEEGIASSSYTACGARLTGDTVIPGAPFVVILGDSYVAAREVRDEQTMGAALEAISRATALPLNVRQYGWGGASPAQYVLAADAVLRRWAPRRVVVLLSDDDLGANAVWGMPPRFRIAGDGTFAIDSGDAPGAQPVALSAFALSGAVQHRWAMIIARAPALVRSAIGPLEAAPQPLLDERDVPGVPDAVVRGLAASFGKRLVIGYVADVRVTGGEEDGRAEQQLVAACAAHEVTCFSTRQAMLRARAHGQAVRGFSNTVAGLGHLNPHGHRLVAEEIWRVIGSH